MNNTYSGVGTHLANLISSLGLKPMHECGCTDMQSQLDSMTIEQIEKLKPQFEVLLNNKQKQLGWVQYIQTIGQALRTGLFLKLDIMNPAKGLLEEAIRLAKLDRTNLESGDNHESNNTSS